MSHIQFLFLMMNTPSIFTYTNFFFPQVDTSETRATSRERHTKQSKQRYQRPMDNYDMDIDNFVTSVDNNNIENKENISDNATNQCRFNPAQVR